MLRGAEAILIPTKIFGHRIFIKKRITKSYREQELDAALRATRTRIEARILLAAKKATNVPRVFHVGGDELWIERIEGELMMNTKVKDDEYVRIGQTLAKIHIAGIVHGDFTPANIMFSKNRERKIWVIDFGLASFSRDTEEQAIDLLLMENAIGKKFALFLEGYKENRQWAAVLNRMQEIKRRGRYFVRRAHPSK